MKRSLLLSVCAASLAVVMFTSAQAVVDVGLELRYTHPADPSQGGEWRLVAKTNDAGGIAGLSAVLTGIDTTNLAFVGAGHDIAPVDQFVDYGNGAYNVVYGQSLVSLTNGVGTAGGPGTPRPDPFGNSAWNNSHVLITGTFSGTRPGFGSSPTGKETEANIFVSGVAQPATIGLTNVRGDSVNSLGLETGTGLFPGDANRDGAVGPADLATVGANWSPTGTTAGWDDGDFDANGAVGPSDLAAVGANWNPTGTNYTPPSIAAVPEPSTAVMLALAGIGLVLRRRLV